MKIVMIGRNDPAGMMIAFANAINRYTEHTARVLSLETRYNFNFEHDLQLPEIQDGDYGEIESLLQNADLIHFHMLVDEHIMVGPLCVRDYIKGKQVLHHHHGHPDFLINAEVYHQKYKQHGRRAIVSTPDLMQILPESTWQPNLVPIHDPEYLPREDHLGRNERVRIIQAPTRKWHKHTEEFQRVTTKLSSLYPFVDVEVLGSTEYRKCLALKRNCHIVFDHMNGWFGISSLESLSHGVPTIAGLDDWNIQQIMEFTGAESLPWVIARSEYQLEEQMRDLVEHPDRRVEIGKQSRRFMEECWGEKDAIRVLLETYSHL